MDEPTPVQDKIKVECNVKDPTAAIWPIVRLIVTAFVAWFGMSTFYSHGFDPQKDGATIALVLTALGGIDGLKRWVATGEVVATKQQ